MLRAVDVGAAAAALAHERLGRALMRAALRIESVAAGAAACLAAAVIGRCRVGEGGVGPKESAPRIGLDFTVVKEQLKLVASHPEIGRVFELHCYETGPFQRGTGSRRDDGSVVFSYEKGGMTSTTTFTPRGRGRISMEVTVDGPLEELRKISYIGPCMQYWHSDAFKRRGKLAEFAGRCFLYTMRGPVGMLETARGRMKGFEPDAPENTPPCTQWYVPIDRPHWGNVWAFGASGDREIEGLVGVVSRDGKWLAAMGCEHNRIVGQGWHDCIHHLPDIPRYVDEKAGRIVHRSMIYVMPNDKQKLFEAFHEDFAPDKPEFDVAVSGGTLRLRPRERGASRLILSLDAVGADGTDTKKGGGAWEPTYWGAFVRAGESWRMWAYPAKDSLDICASFANGGPARASARMAGKGWVKAEAPWGVPAQVLRSADGRWTAGLFWERSEPGKPSLGIPARGEEAGDTVSVRGRLCLYRGDPSLLAKRWAWARNDWKNAIPYRMPVADRP